MFNSISYIPLTFVFGINSPSTIFNALFKVFPLMVLLNGGCANI